MTAMKTLRKTLVIGATKMKTTSIVFALIALAILTGCTSTTVHLRPDLTFQTKDAKLRKSVLISISTDTKNYVLKSKAGVGTWTVPIGQALEPNALRAFAAVIEKAVAYTCLLYTSDAADE